MDLKNPSTAAVMLESNEAVGEPLIWSPSRGGCHCPRGASHQPPIPTSLCACDGLAGIRCLGVRFDAPRTAGRGKTRCRLSAATFCQSNGTFQKSLFKTNPCNESSITSACYLCNTRRKRRGVTRFEAVPLLRVQKSSVIVMARRRGASRGRPVLGGSLKSLAFMRECPKARSG